MTTAAIEKMLETEVYLMYLCSKTANTRRGAMIFEAMGVEAENILNRITKGKT